ncbi:GLPGLI family protein [Chitinophaga sp. SYP-B3965]|uniref:GLPGLI family protein n=1 Tax=Chitinophaga sp. SYP-B3965 TaxID=2663120 RepID=UPI001299BAE7|nr:GLPGLI family protein [Chitinophaga sp. SYP-B3965]MRG46555.1 GLPGLI family protein [Chitinophaga sp. SYP-B3965]
MKTIITAMLLLTANAQAQQKNSGVIEYEVTSRMDLSNARIVMMGPGGQVTQGSGADMPDLPDLITNKQTLTFSSTKGKLEIEGGGGPQIMSMRGAVPAGGATMRMDVAGSSSGNASFSGAPFGAGGPGGALRPPLSNATYIDLANKKYLTVTTEKKDSVTSNSWYAEEDYKQSAEIKNSEKTKTIAGFKCHKATVKLGEENFVFWYTTEIPLLFSPVNGVLPAEGVVLSIESSKRSYVAKKIEFKPIEDTEVSLPANAQKITEEELKAKRRQILEKFHNERLEKLQQLNSNN